MAEGRPSALYKDALPARLYPAFSRYLKARLEASERVRGRALKRPRASVIVERR